MQFKTLCFIKKTNLINPEKFELIKRGLQELNLLNVYKQPKDNNTKIGKHFHHKKTFVNL